MDGCLMGLMYGTCVITQNNIVRQDLKKMGKIWIGKYLYVNLKFMSFPIIFNDLRTIFQLESEFCTFFPTLISS